MEFHREHDRIVETFVHVFPYVISLIYESYAYAYLLVPAYIVCIIAMGGVNDMSAAFGFGHGFTSTAAILVLFILLVIVSRSFGFGI